MTRARLASAAALGAALAVAAFLRLDGLGVPSFWLDEILHQQLTTTYAALPWWRWLGRLHEEHAGLYYLTQLATRLFGTGEAGARAAAALFGITTVPVAWRIARDTRGGAIAAAATAILLATSPLHVYFSREARSYALLALLTAALTLVLLRGRSLFAAAVVLLALLYTSAVSATIVLSALLVAALCALFAERTPPHPASGHPLPAPRGEGQRGEGGGEDGGDFEPDSPSRFPSPRTGGEGVRRADEGQRWKDGGDVEPVPPSSGTLPDDEPSIVAGDSSSRFPSPRTRGEGARRADEGRPIAPRRRWDLGTALACMATVALFRLVYTAGPVENANWPGFPELNAQFAGTLLRTFSVSALGTPVAGRTVVAMSLFALIGAIALVREDRRKAIVIAGMSVFPLAISLAALKTLDHFFAIRYVMASVVGFTVLAGIGIAAVTTFLCARIHRHAAPLAAVLLAALTAAQTWPAARFEPFQKLDWRTVAATIAAHARPGDIAIAAESWSEVSLRHYLDQHPRAPRLVGVPQVELVEMIRGDGPGMWLLSAGYEDSPLRRWMCAFPMIAASPLENLRLHYVSRTSDFLRERGGPAELRAFVAALGPRGFTLSMAEGEERFFGEGWAQPERAGRDAFRWAAATRATVDVPRFGALDRVLRMLALPFEHRSLGVQSVRISVNGHHAGELTLRSGWSEYSVPVAAHFWRDGWNRVTFDFARATAPSALDPRSHDSRLLAASFAWLAVDDAGAPPSRERDFPVVTLPRSATGALLNRDSLWLRGGTRFSPASLRREETTALLGRLGFDPETIWPRVQRGELHLEELAESLAYGQDCVDGDTFLRQAFTVILDRLPNDHDKRDLHPRMRNGMPRTEVVRRILKSAVLERR